MFLLFFLLWIVLNGRITLEIVLFGILVSGIITLFVYRAAGFSLTSDLRLLRNIPWLLLYIINLLAEIVKATAAVLSVIYTPGKGPEPVIVEFHSHLPARRQNVLLANSITLTPGTFTLFLEGDHFVIHCLRPEYAEGLEDSSFIRLLRRMK